ncbi:MAG: preprotein translocase subunit YajC [Muribaculaceae bacterium]|nr:preprotein translocase subunit YajC [Muribaculaceae bacterium]
MNLNLIALQDANGGGMQLLMIVALIVIFYFFMIRPQQKKQKEIRKFREALDKGDRIITAGGIHGRIVEVKDVTFLIEVAKGVTILIDKNSVYPSADDAKQAQENAQELRK